MIGFNIESPFVTFVSVVPLKKRSPVFKTFSFRYITPENELLRDPCYFGYILVA